MRKGAAHGFRNLSGITIPLGFEQAITEMKIKSDEIVNSFSSCRNLSLFFTPIPSAKGAAREIPRRPWPISFRCSGEDQRHLEQVAVHQQL